MSYVNAFKRQHFAGLFVSLFAAMSSQAQAGEINAGYLLSKMNTDQQVSYVAGVVEGLAFSRYLRDKPDQSGIKCVYHWYDQNSSKSQIKKMDNWFARHPDKPVGALLHVLIKKRCGE